MLRTLRNQAKALRALAERYLRLAKTTADPRERNKFFNYAAVMRTCRSAQSGTAMIESAS